MLYQENITVLSSTQDQIRSLEKEALETYSALVLPNWCKEMHGFPETLYGYMMRIFSHVDLLSSYWKGNNKDQTNRMIEFMNRYMNSDKEANIVSVKVWRHTLMHTAQPRSLKSNSNGKTYRWLLHWYEHLPQEQHYTFSDSASTRILNIGLVYLIRDLKLAAESYHKDLSDSKELQGNFNKFQQQLELIYRTSGTSRK